MAERCVGATLDSTVDATGAWKAGHRAISSTRRYSGGHLAKADSSSPEAIRDAIHAMLAEPGMHRHGEKVLNRLFNAPGHQMTRKALCDEFHPGLLSLWFGTLCKAVAKELGDPDPAPYALTSTISTPEGEALRLKPSVVKAMGG